MCGAESEHAKRQSANTRVVAFPRGEQRSEAMRTILAAVALALATQSVIAQAPDNSAAPLEGIWLAEVSQPALQGELIITRQGIAWSGAIADQHPSVTVRDGRLSFNLANGQGEFRGAISGSEIRGVWTQPPTLS